MDNISKTPFIELSKVRKIDWDSPKLKAEICKIRKQNDELLETTKPDTQKMYIRFDV